ncbi:hypothetical protein BDK51DRAFT_39010 [Blyttiomyces helicus]|uniref:Uncharacterized protein n=1 Tax=Blyttiomyces helicus TaxID=388810 RepID=A0A4P9WCY7_9FUNG|nr:hypothetical protein BDK51DRAFT_39010 [Blyttiomyces helicus]|eukprot:RKO90531.1 hypothetical protein BDK51DRAFT_39010 [Blyttiomyces helicus]
MVIVAGAGSAGSFTLKSSDAMDYSTYAAGTDSVLVEVDARVDDGRKVGGKVLRRRQVVLFGCPATAGVKENSVLRIPTQIPKREDTRGRRGGRAKRGRMRPRRSSLEFMTTTERRNQFNLAKKLRQNSRSSFCLRRELNCYLVPFLAAPHWIQMVNQDNGDRAPYRARRGHPRLRSRHPRAEREHDLLSPLRCGRNLDIGV